MMKKRYIALFGLVLGGVIAQERGQGQGTNPLPGDYGPGQGGAVLKQPGMAGQPQPGTAAAPSWWSTPYAGNPEARNTSPFAGLIPAEGPDPNQDITVTPAQGSWLICVNSYTGPDAPRMARDMVMELQATYKIPAFVFSHGREERRKEYERVQAIIQKQKEFFEKNNLPVTMPIRVKYQRIEEQCAVLVGGYKDQESARRALEQVRKLQPPDPNRVKLPKKFYVKEDPKTGKPYGEEVWVNPFAHAFPVPNPTLRQQRPAEANQLDIETLRRLNADERFSLLKCPKPITLAVKQFQLPTVVSAHSSSNSFLDTLGLGSKGGDRVDAAAVSAHNLADLLHKAKLDSYVLHTRFNSIVTVGAFDSFDDPALKSMQQLLASRLKLDPIQLFPQPIPMKVPR